MYPVTPAGRRRLNGPPGRGLSPPVPDTEVVWALVDACAAWVAPARRAALFAEIAAGEYLAAADQLLQATLLVAQPLPHPLLQVVDAWLNRYEGCPDQVVVRRLLARCRMLDACIAGSGGTGDGRSTVR